MFKSRNFSSSRGRPLQAPNQLNLTLNRPREKDRNYHHGGRSFYFFDFDDNVASLATPIIIFNKKTGEEKAISSHEYAQHGKYIGHEGLYKEYFISLSDSHCSFAILETRK